MWFVECLVYMRQLILHWSCAEYIHSSHFSAHGKAYTIVRIMLCTVNPSHYHDNHVIYYKQTLLYKLGFVATLHTKLEGYASPDQPALDHQPWSNLSEYWTCCDTAMKTLAFCTARALSSCYTSLSLQYNTCRTTAPCNMAIKSDPASPHYPKETEQKTGVTLDPRWTNSWPSQSWHPSVKGKYYTCMSTFLKVFWAGRCQMANTIDAIDHITLLHILFTG